MKKLLVVVFLICSGTFLFSQSNEAWNGFDFGMSPVEVKNLIESKLAPYDNYKEYNIELNRYSKTAPLFQIYGDRDFLSIGNNEYKNMKTENILTNSSNCSIIEFRCTQSQYYQNGYGSYARNIKFYFDENQLIGIYINFSANNNTLLNNLKSNFGKENIHYEIISQVWSYKKYNNYLYNVYYWISNQRMNIFYKYGNVERSDYWIINKSYAERKRNEIEEMIQMNREEEDRKKAEEENEKNDGVVF